MRSGMKKLLLITIVLLLSVSISLLGCTNEGNNGDPQQTDENDSAAVKKLVEDFGDRLKTVSLLAPEESVKKSMQENYGDYVSTELLAEWQNDPQNAPGRLTSSPWPDRIEVLAVEKLAQDSYEVKGEIIEVTSTELESGEAAAKRPINLGVEKIENRWLIVAVTIGGYDDTDSIVYENTQYGFSFSLPKSWEGYSIITGNWEGLPIGDAEDDEAVKTGPMISIRHPEWTSEKPRQDIPIMIFTLSQWDALQNEEFHIGAAPIGPKELGRNDTYVFALPARYNFAFPEGYEEVEDILDGNPLRAKTWLK